MIPCADCRAELPAYAAGELPEIERQALRAHLTGCGPCRAEATSLAFLEVRVRDSLQASSEPLPPGFAAAIRARVLDVPRAKSSFLSRWFGPLHATPARLVAALSIAAVAVALGWGERFVPGPERLAPPQPDAVAAAIPAAPASAALLELAEDPDALFAAWGAGLIESSDLTAAARTTWGDSLESDGEMARRVATGELTDDEARAISAVFGGDEGI